MNVRNIILAVMVFSMAAFGQAIAGFGPAGVTINAGVADAYQINYLPNTAINGGGFVDLINSGALGASITGPLVGLPVGYICVNVYVFDASDEQLTTCCTCPLSPNEGAHLTSADLLKFPATGQVPASLVVKLVATLPKGEVRATAGTTGTQTCVGATSLPGTVAGAIDVLAPGLRAWATKIHVIPAGGGAAGFNQSDETAFLPADLSPGEYFSLVSRCANIVGNGSGAGVCAACTPGVLGGKKK